MNLHRLMSQHLVLGTLFCLSLTMLGNRVLAQGAIDIEKPDVKAAKTDKKPAPITSPAVRELMRTKPTTAIEIFRTMSLLVDLGRADLAEPFAKQFLELDIEDATLANIISQFGTATLLRFNTAQKLQGLGVKISRKILAGSNRHYTDPVRLDTLIKQLSSENATKRGRALIDLRKARHHGTVALVHILADSTRAIEHPAIRNALVLLGQSSINPLLGSLESNDVKLKIQVIDCLKRLQAPEASIHLLAATVDQKTDPSLRQAASTALQRIVGRTVSVEQAILVLENRATRYLNGRARLTTGENDSVTLWHWDAQKKQPYSKSYPHDVALTIQAAEFATDLYQLSPQKIQHRQLYLTCVLQAAKLKIGLHQSVKNNDPAVYKKTAALGPAAIDDILRFAIKKNHTAAAIAAAELLGDVGSADLLVSHKNRTAALLLALRHSNRHLRFAALEAIVKLNPQKPYAGSSHVTAALGYFASSAGVPRAVVADPRASKAQSIAGLLIQLGYDVEIATTGRECFRIVASSPDFELVLIDLAISDPTAVKLFQQLRHDLRTASLPIGLLATPGKFRVAERFASLDPLVTAFAHAQNVRTMKYQVDLLMKRAKRTRLTTEQRLAQAKLSLQWMAKLIDKNSKTRKIYDIRRDEAAVLQALHVPSLSIAATKVLAQLGSKKSQRTLVDLTSTASKTMAIRQAAYDAWITNISQYGLTLTPREIKRQYDRYNASARLDKNTQKLLGRILDTLEIEQGLVKRAKAADQKEKTKSSPVNKK